MDLVAKLNCESNCEQPASVEAYGPCEVPADFGAAIPKVEDLKGSDVNSATTASALAYDNPVVAAAEALQDGYRRVTRNSTNLFAKIRDWITGDDQWMVDGNQRSDPDPVLVDAMKRQAGFACITKQNSSVRK